MIDPRSPIPAVGTLRFAHPTESPIPDYRSLSSVGLRAGLRHLTAGLAHGGGGGVRHQAGVVEQRAQLIALAEAPGRGLCAIGVDAGDLAVPARDVADFLDRGE